MSIKIQVLAEQITKTIESLVFNGLNLVTKDNVRQIEQYLQQSAQVEAHRVSISLRNIHIELDHFLKNKGFNPDRYIFFLSNCWLLCKAINGEHALDSMKDEKFKNSVMGSTQQTEILRNIHLKTVGVEKIIIEGSMYGFIYHILMMHGIHKGKIFRWNLMQPYRGPVQPETLLSLKIKINKTMFSPKQLLNGYFIARNVPFIPSSSTMFLEKGSNMQLELVEPNVAGKSRKFKSVMDILQIHYSHDEIYLQDEILRYKITPFDLYSSYSNYILLHDVKILNKITRSKQKDKSTLIYELEHAENYGIVFEIPEVLQNRYLLEELDKQLEKQDTIEMIFCRFSFHHGQIAATPLSIVKQTDISYPTLSKSINTQIMNVQN